jgi:hypothetical protein
MAYSGFFTFGDSLVDSGNALKLAQWYGTLTFSDLPEGAPTASQGYFQGRFSNGYTFADLLSNKEIGAVTKPVFPYGYEDPWLGIPVAPWAGDPSGNNLNFAYGGAQIKQGKEVVSDLDAQTDAFRDAVDGHADPNALHMVTVGGNDIRSLVPAVGTVVGKTQAYATLDNRADILLHELSQLVTMDGVKHILITGMADVGLVERYDRDKDNALGPDMDLNGDGIIDPGEATRSAAATDYSRYLDHLIRAEVIPGLKALGATVTYVPLMDYVDEATHQPVTGALTANLNTIAVLNGVVPDELGETPGEQLRENLLLYDNLLFFDGLHPNAQANALLGAFMHAPLHGTPWVETIPLLAADVDYRSVGTIALAGEVDSLVIAAAASSSYTFQMLGVSSLTPYVLTQLGLGALPAGPILGDPRLNLVSSSGAVIASDDDSGAGFDASMIFNVVSGGTYTLQASAVGALTGSYALTISVDGAAVNGGNIYVVNHASAIVVEGAGWAGVDTVNASVSYTLAAGSAIEVLQTTNAKGKGAINLTGNEFAQQITGNNGANVLDGRGGDDDLRGGGGNDRFVIGTGGIDRILDYSSGDVVDVSTLVKVAAGVNVVSGGFVRVTTSGKVQVDADGGGNGWTTISTINGTGSVSVRYLSGATATTVSLSRVAETYSSSSLALAGLVAAAGLAAPVAASPEPVQVSNLVASDPISSVSESSLEPLGEKSSSEPLEGRSIAAEAHEQLIFPAASPLAHALLPASGSEPVQQAATYLAGTEVQAAQSTALVAPSVAIPADFGLAEVASAAHTNAEVGRVLLDALAGGGAPGTIGGVIDALPSGAEQAPASLAHLEPAIAAPMAMASFSYAGFAPFADHPGALPLA